LGGFAPVGQPLGYRGHAPGPIGSASQTLLLALATWDHGLGE